MNLHSIYTPKHPSSLLTCEKASLRYQYLWMTAIKRHINLKRITNRQIKHQVPAAPIGTPEIYFIHHPPFAFGAVGDTQRHGQVGAENEERKVEPQPQSGAHGHLIDEVLAECRTGLFGVGVLEPDVPRIDKCRPVNHASQLSPVFRIEFYFNIACLVGKKIVLTVKLGRVGARAYGACPEGAKSVGTAREELLHIGEHAGV